jgi:hypothetical protein
MSKSSDFAVGQRVRVYPGSSDECFGVIVEGFGDSAGYAVTVGNTRPGPKPIGHFTVGRDQKFLEVPLNVACLAALVSSV